MGSVQTANRRSNNWKHGEKETRLYHIWIGIKGRCLNETNPAFPRYGGRGIMICDEWRSDYAAFSLWARSCGYSDDLQIDRIDNNDGYRPENCRWVTAEINSNNRQSNRVVVAFGESKTLSHWSKDGRCKVSYDTLKYRLRVARMDAEVAMTMPAEDFRHGLVEAFGEVKSINEWASDYRCIVGKSCLRMRLIKGWFPTAELAITTPTDESKSHVRKRNHPEAP